MTTTERIAAEIARVNYRRRVRRIDEADVAQVLREAKRDGVGYYKAGTVARAYDYPATTAAVAAVKKDNVYFVTFDSIDAKRNASPVTWFGPNSVRDRDVESWHDRLKVEELRKYPAWIELSRREALQIMRDSMTLVADPKLTEKVPDVMVSRQDSLDAGNCVSETERVIAMFGGTRGDDNFVVQAKHLIAVLASREPGLLKYARKAVARAQWRERQEVAHA